MDKYLHYKIEGVSMDLIKYTDRHSYNTRFKEDFVHPKPRTNQLNRSAILTWNLRQVLENLIT